MKQFLLLLVLLFSLGVKELNASNLDSLLVKEYESCRTELFHIIEKENLKESLTGQPFYAYMVGRFWMIVAKKGEITSLFFKERDSSRFATQVYLCGKEALTGPFSLIDLDIANNRRQEESGYNPFFRYFALFNSDGSIHYEWSSSTYCDDNERISYTLEKCISFVLDACLH